MGLHQLSRLKSGNDLVTVCHPAGTNFGDDACIASDCSRNDDPLGTATSGPNGRREIDTRSGLENISRSQVNRNPLIVREQKSGVLDGGPSPLATVVRRRIRWPTIVALGLLIST